MNVKVHTENDKFFNIGMIPTRGTSDSVECLRLIEIRLIVCVIPRSRPTVLYDSLHSGNNIDGLLN